MRSVGQLRQGAMHAFIETSSQGKACGIEVVTNGCVSLPLRIAKLTQHDFELYDFTWILMITPSMPVTSTD
jgi:hypothetical protein